MGEDTSTPSPIKKKDLTGSSKKAGMDPDTAMAEWKVSEGNLEVRVVWKV